MAAGWKDFGGMPEEAKRSLAQGCKAAVDSLKAAATNCGL
jgi:hypothetical protein